MTRDGKYPCGHSRSAANTVQRKKMPGQPYRRACKTCEQQQSREAQARRISKSRRFTPKPRIQPRPTPAYLALMAEAKAQFDRLMRDPLRKPGRPRKVAA